MAMKKKWGSQAQNISHWGEFAITLCSQNLSFYFPVTSICWMLSAQLPHWITLCSVLQVKVKIFPGGAVLGFECLYWTLWALRVLWPLSSRLARQDFSRNKIRQETFFQKFLEYFPAWLAWTNSNLAPFWQSQGPEYAEGPQGPI